MADDDSVEEGEVDPDFVPEANRTTDEDHVGVQRLAQEAQMAPKQRRAPTKRRQTTKVTKTTSRPANSLPTAPLPAPLAVGMTDDMTDLVQHESILDFVVDPLPEGSSAVNLAEKPLKHAQKLPGRRPVRSQWSRGSRNREGDLRFCSPKQGHQR
ncbi:unnamed protein product [Aureobasidium mustum]|uniref:Uncharacterized protein n=1 Tax=Aureobasidium mustum TaxID=2773714 RepID=A0A9N8PA20_9PEZI|nr:unnamed protein product [Aureobasidium mustum]